MDRNHYFDGEFSVVEDDDENGTFALANPDGEVVSEYYECIEPFDENHVCVNFPFSVIIVKTDTTGWALKNMNVWISNTSTMMRMVTGPRVSAVFMKRAGIH